VSRACTPKWGVSARRRVRDYKKSIALAYRQVKTKAPAVKISPFPHDDFRYQIVSAVRQTEISPAYGRQGLRLKACPRQLKAMVFGRDVAP
jgi:hypothetical protein